MSREGEFSVFPGNVWCWKEALCCRGLKSTATAGSGRDGSLYSGMSVFYNITVVIVAVVVTFSLSLACLSVSLGGLFFPQPTCRNLPYPVRRGTQTQTRRVLIPLIESWHLLSKWKLYGEERSERRILRQLNLIWAVGVCCEVG